MYTISRHILALAWVGCALACECVSDLRVVFCDAERRLRPSPVPPQINERDSAAETSQSIRVANRRWNTGTAASPSSSSSSSSRGAASNATDSRRQMKAATILAALACLLEVTVFWTDWYYCCSCCSGCCCFFFHK